MSSGRTRWSSEMNSSPTCKVSSVSFLNSVSRGATMLTSRAGIARRIALARVRPPQRLDVDLLHLEHRRHQPLRPRRVLVADQLDQRRGDHLPRDAELVSEPAALDFLAAGGELRPEVVDFLLRLAVHHQRDRLGELEERPAVERGEVLPVELEGHGHDRPLRPAGGLGGLVGIAVDALDPGIRKYRHVEAGSLLGPVVEPEERGDSLRDCAHRSLLNFTISSWVGRTVGSGIDNPQVPLDMLPKAAIYTQ